MSRLAGEGRAAWVETSYAVSVRSGQDQTQNKDTPAASPVSISGRWQRDPAGQVGSIELLDAQYFGAHPREPRLAGDDRPEGSGAGSAPPWRATRFD
jgi:hypothetical protein